MLEVITIDNANKWDKIIDSFELKDAYYYSGYQKAFMLHGDGNPILFYYHDNDTRAINVAMKRDIAKDKNFNGILQENSYFDLATPYGYGGFIVEGKEIEKLNKEYTSYCKESDIVSEFVRLHPVLDNKEKLINMYDITTLGPTITMDISDRDGIWQNFSSKNRNVIRKAQAANIAIYNGNSQELYALFK